MSVTVSQVQKIKRSGVWGRNVTSCIIALAIVGMAFMCLLVAMGGVQRQTVSIGPYQFPSTALEPWSARAYVMSMLATFGRDGHRVAVPDSRGVLGPGARNIFARRTCAEFAISAGWPSRSESSTG
jgi:hypothetical protein